MAALSAPAQAIAQAALQAWTNASGINFQVTANFMGNYNEGADAGNSTGTARAAVVNSALSGSVGGTDTGDFYSFTLAAGESISATLRRNGGTLDGVLTIYNSLGQVVAQSDDPNNAAAIEALSFTASSAGRYYVVASGFGSTAGSYIMEVLSGAAITFNDIDPSGAYAFSNLSGTTILNSYINIPDSWDTLNQNGYMLQTYMHEIGHALGLGHAGPYNGTATWGTNNAYDNDSWSATIMSYFSQTDNPIVPGSFAYLATVMPADVIAIQNLYGAWNGSNTNSTVYGVGANMGGYLQTLMAQWTGQAAATSNIYVGNPISFTIVDSAGYDTINFSNFAVNQVIDLNQLAYSDIGGLVDNVTIARYSIIEAAVGGSGADTLIGNEYDNSLTGNAGADLLLGGLSNDILFGGAGSDTLNGGDGFDTVSYSNDAGQGGTTGVYVDLAAGYAQDGFGNNESLVSIEAAYGTDRNRSTTLSDILIGNSGNNTLSGYGGLDYIIGNAGDDYIDTGNGAIGATGDIASGGLGSDYIVGGSGATFIYGDDGSDILDGGAGDDWLFGGAYSGMTAGHDIMTGGTGNDILTVGSAGGSATMYGGTGNDTLYGGSSLTGARNDILVGGAGSDYMYGDIGSDSFSFAVADLVSGDFDQIGDFGSQDYLGFAAALQGLLYVAAATYNGVSGTYIGYQGWALWLPYTDPAFVQSHTFYA
jgi:hypothetical protein